WWLAMSTAVVVLAVLSDPLTAVLLPIALVFAIRGREWRGWVLPGCIALGLVLQLALRDEGTSSFGGSDYGVLPRFFAERVTSSLLVGDRYLKDVFGGTTWSPFAWASLAVVAVAVVLATIVVGYAAPHRSSGERRWKPVLAQARLACARQRDIKPIKLYRDAQGLAAVLPIDPGRWSMPIDCSKLR